MCLHKLHEACPHLRLLRGCSPPPAGSVSVRQPSIRPSVHPSSFSSSFPFILEHESTVEAGSVARGRGLLGLKVCVLVSCLAVRPDTLRRKSTSWGGEEEGRSGVPLHSSQALPSLAGWPQPRAECKSVSCLEKKTFLWASSEPHWGLSSSGHIRHWKVRQGGLGGTGQRGVGPA